MPGLNEAPEFREAVARWRRELRTCGLRRAADLDEIESHLLDHCDDLLRRGLMPPEAFAAALARLGPAAELAREYRKIAREELLMKVLRVLVHGIALAFINLAAIVAGFFVYLLLRPGDQRLIQVSAALLFSGAGFFIWQALAARISRQVLTMHSSSEFLLVSASAFLWGPVIFLPLHYIIRGHLSAFGNIVGLWIFQFIANLLLWVCFEIVQAYRAGTAAGSSAPHPDPEEPTHV